MNGNARRSPVLAAIAAGADSIALLLASPDLAGLPRRTLQRDLEKLVDRGAIKSAGSARATTYSVTAGLEASSVVSRPGVPDPVSKGSRHKLMVDYSDTGTVEVGLGSRETIEALEALSYALELLDKYPLNDGWPGDSSAGLVDLEQADSSTGAMSTGGMGVPNWIASFHESRHFWRQEASRTTKVARFFLPDFLGFNRGGEESRHTVKHKCYGSPRLSSLDSERPADIREVVRTAVWGLATLPVVSDAQLEAASAALRMDASRGTTRVSRSRAEEIVEAYRAGERHQEIVSRFGVHRSTVTRVLRAAGIGPARPVLGEGMVGDVEAFYAAGYSVAATARHFGVSRNTILAFMERHGLGRRERYAWHTPLSPRGLARAVCGLLEC